jgi:glycosyl transferase family 87
VCLACFGSAILILTRLVQLSLIPSLLLVAVVGTVYAPFLSDLGVGNVNELQLFAVALFALCEACNRRFLGGMVLGVAIAFKPNTSLLLVLWMGLILTDRQIRRGIPTLVGASVGVLTSVIAALPYFGPAVWLDFAKSLPKTLDRWYPLENGNVGVPSVVFELTRIDVSWAMLSALCMIFGVVLWKTRAAALGRSRESPITALGGPGGDVGQLTVLIAGLSGAIVVLSSRLAWLHYYVLLLPLWLYLIRPTSEGQSPTTPDMIRKGLAMIAFLFCSRWAYAMGSTAIQRDVMLNAGVALMVMLALYELWLLRRRSAVAAIESWRKRPRRSRRTDSRRSL